MIFICTLMLNLKSGNLNLSVNLIQPENLKPKNPALIFIHGWSSNQTGNIERAKELAKIGFICLTIDLRGHGLSDGKLEEFSRKDHLEDALVAYDYLKSQPDVDHEQIGVIGASYGAYLGAILTLHRKIKWLVMRVPALYFDEKFNVPSLELIGDNKEKEAFRSFDLTPEKALPLKGVSEFSGDILLIESEKDAMIPHATIENYLDFINKKQLTYKVMQDTPHDLRTDSQKKNYIDILIQWFKGRV